MQLKGRVALITGASSGIGEALALELGRAGMTCILVARRTEELERVADAIQVQTKRPEALINGDVDARPAGGSEARANRPLTVACDVTDATALQTVASELEASLPDGIDLLILNAGRTMHGRFDESTSAALRQIMDLNFFGAVETVRAFLPLMKRAKGKKKIVLISTPSGLYGISERSAYGASKAAAQSFLESLSHELREDDISTAIFYPGYVATALRTSGIGADGSPIQEEQAPNAKAPEEVARIFCKAIASDKRKVFTNFTGRFIYYARVLAPVWLDSLIRKKH